MRVPALLFVLLTLLPAVCAIQSTDNWPDEVPRDADVIENASVVEYIATERLETGLEIERSVPEAVLPGEPFTVELFVSNPTDEGLSILVVDPVRPGLSYLSAPEPALFHYDGLAVRLLQWRTVVPANGMVDYSYRAVATGPGALSLAPATVSDPYGNVYESAMSIIEVGCHPNGACDGGETYLSCPEDCPTGSEDDLCDGVADGRVDPDCVGGADPDAGGGSPPSAQESEPFTIPATDGEEGPGSMGTVGILLIVLAGIIIAAVAILLTRKKKKYCIECGAKLAADAQYCTQCGKAQ